MNALWGERTLWAVTGSHCKFSGRRVIQSLALLSDRSPHSGEYDCRGSCPINPSRGMPVALPGTAATLGFWFLKLLGHCTFIFMTYFSSRTLVDKSMHLFFS